MKDRYGASPLHLIAHLVGLALSAVVLDLVRLPFFSTLDRAGQRAAPGPAINYVRVPALISGLLLLVFLPAIANKGEPSFNRVSGLTYDGYFARWLLITAALFAISGAAYLVRGSR